MKFKTFIPDSETRTVTSEIESSIELTDYYMVSHEGYYADIVDEKLGVTENQLRKTMVLPFKMLGS